MDRSLLTEDIFIEASKGFVCARLLTYENKSESEFLVSISGNRTGALLNTLFVVLSPDGETPLTQSGRSPRNAFAWPEDETTERLVAMMEKIATQYPGNGKQQTPPPIPYLVDVRRSLNTAACDNQPLVVVAVENEDRRSELEIELAKLAWDSDFSGKFSYAKSLNSADLEKIKDAEYGSHIYVVQPGEHGLNGQVLAKSNRFDEASLQQVLTRGMSKFQHYERRGRRLAEANRNGIEWEEEDLEARYPDGNAAKRRNDDRTQGENGRRRRGGK